MSNATDEISDTILTPVHLYLNFWFVTVLVYLVLVILMSSKKLLGVLFNFLLLF